MKQITVTEALRLVRTKPSPSISIYVGTNIPAPDGPSRIKNNLRRLYRNVEAAITKNYEPKLRERLLAPLRRALAGLRLTGGEGGVGIYHSEEFTGIVKLPFAVPDLAVAAGSFHLKPVLRCAQLRRNHYMLVLRKRYADLIATTVDGSREVERIVLPLKMDKADADEEHKKRWCRDVLKIRKRKDLRLAMVALNRQLESYWQGERRPLLLAGPKHLVDSFKAACTYSHILDKSIEGTIDHLDLNAVVAMGSSIMEQYFSDLDLQAIANFYRAKAAGMASTDLRQIAQAAANSQVQSLLVAEDRHVWGTIDCTTGCIQLSEQGRDGNTDDLLDDIAEMTLLKGGRVTVLPSSEMPGRGPIAAVLRWQGSRLSASPQKGQQSLIETRRMDHSVELGA